MDSPSSKTFRLKGVDIKTAQYQIATDSDIISALGM